jgi:3-oxoacyl-[acyl-carrier protein] reductase
MNPGVQKIEDIAGKTAVITGCLQGIGRATMELFAHNRANVFACAQAPNAEFETLCAELASNNGVFVTPVYFDLTNDAAIKASALTIQKSGYAVDCLINIAGITKDANFHMITAEQLRLVFQINVFSLVTFTQYISRLMLRKKQGSIINIASITGITGNPGQATYAASKAAVIALTKTLASELGPQGIRVNAVAPGVVDTPMTRAVTGSSLQNLVDRSSLGRIGLPEEVASTCLFLASAASSFVTGQVIRVDGGIN